MHKSAFVGTTFTAPKERCSYLTDVVLQYVEASRPLRVLEVGCGTGAQLSELANALPAASLTGVDISTTSIQVAEAARQQHPFGTRMAFIAKDYLEFSVSPFDVILSDSTLQNIAISTPSLFGKVAADLLPGGLFFNSMPYACFYNHLLWTARRLCRLIRSPLTDAVFLRIAIRLHHRQFSEALLRQRIHYMYLLPYRYHSHHLSRCLDQAYDLQQIAEHPVPHTSVAQPKHRLAVFRKRG
jgi:ubiquinone/menaquinone biosynthesis C-methylase UbiE